MSVTPCFAAVAETGSLVLLSGAQSPTTLNFVPDDHIVIVRRNQIMRHIEEVWAQVRLLGDMLPRAINVISGPSRTADVEQTVQLARMARGACTSSWSRLSAERSAHPIGRVDLMRG